MAWAYTELAELSLAKPQYGANAKAAAPEPNDPKPNYLRITDIDDCGRLVGIDRKVADLVETDQYRLNEGDLLVARTGNTVGKSYLYDPADGDCIFAGYLIRFRINQQKILPKLALYFTLSPAYKNWVQSKKRVGGQPNINGAEYSTLKIPYPEGFPEQHRIIEILDQADALRRKRREADALSERILPALFHRMFGDVVSNTNQWPIKPLGEVSESRLGKMLDKGRDGGVSPKSYLANLNVKWGEFDLSNLRTMDFSEKDQTEFKLEDGDVLVCEGGEVGRSAIWRSEITDVYFQKALHRVRVDRQSLTPEYYQMYMKAMAENNGFDKHVGIAVIGHLTGVKLKKLPIPTPPLELQLEFSKNYIQIQNLDANGRSSSKHLETLFQSLLRRAFEGRLTANWRETHAELKEGLQELEHQAKA